jgi:hypothetical protein
MISPFEFEEARHLQPPAPSVSRDPQDAKRQEAVQDFVIVLVIVAVFAGALYFLLLRNTETLSSPVPKLPKERWKDWRPLDE